MISTTTRIDYLVTPDGARIALHRMGNPEHPRVLLIPGTFSNHTFWLGTRGVGFARTLADAGYEACVLDPRGHGVSDRPTRKQHWDIDDWARADVPTALRALASAEQPVFIIGHSAGGAVTLAALSADQQLHALVRGVVTIGTPVPWLQPWRGIGAWLIRATSEMLGRFPARLLRLGPEDELPRVMSQWMTWNIEGHWTGDDGTDYSKGLEQLHMPFLMIAGTADRFFAPPYACEGLFKMVGSARKQFKVFRDLDHVGLMVSRRARAEVWPCILGFLSEQ
ncbi:MAG TPA: alpha/beta fold hydrolase [Longimicrobiales bacterium]|nr:alpha/beta fold hydrolase [Longimicrobiales bacterium]